MQFKPRNQTKVHVEGHLWKFICQRANKTDLWKAFSSALADVYYE